jgi:hypothetical protein
MAPSTQERGFATRCRGQGAFQSRTPPLSVRCEIIDAQCLCDLMSVPVTGSWCTRMVRGIEVSFPAAQNMDRVCKSMQTVQSTRAVLRTIGSTARASIQRRAGIGTRVVGKGTRCTGKALGTTAAAGSMLGSGKIAHPRSLPRSSLIAPFDGFSAHMACILQVQREAPRTGGVDVSERRCLRWGVLQQRAAWAGPNAVQG